MSLICGCVSSDDEPLLKEVLGVFSAEWAGSPENVYLNSRGLEDLIKKFGEQQVCLILALLDSLEIVGHSGSLVSSSYLTHKGLSVRDSLNSSKKEES